MTKYCHKAVVAAARCLNASLLQFTTYSTILHLIAVLFIILMTTCSLLLQKKLCLRYRDLFVSICNFLKIPLAPNKFTAPAQNTTFLGITLDTLHGQARLPQEKVVAYTRDIENILPLTKISVKHLQSILGKLSFATAVMPGRVFLRGLISLLPKHNMHTGPVNITSEAKQDLLMWLAFLQVIMGSPFSEP